MKQREDEQAVRAIIRRALERRRQVLVFETARKFQNLLEERKLDSRPEETLDNNWVRIESLSRLRALVGGRFQNLKDRWVRAGFPLREHRGDRSGKKNFDYDGWIELSAWIHKQGYELRLAGESEPWLFEIRKLG